MQLIWVHFCDPTPDDVTESVAIALLDYASAAAGLSNVSNSEAGAGWLDLGPTGLLCKIKFSAHSVAVIRKCSSCYAEMITVQLWDT